MKQSPIGRSVSIFADGLGQRVALRATTFVLLTLGIYALGRFGLSANDPLMGTTMLFMILAIGSMIDIYPIKRRSPLTWASIKANREINIGVCLAAVIVFAIALVPGLQHVFELTAMPVLNWMIVLVAVFVPSVILEINKRVQRKRRPEEIQVEDVVD